MNPTQAEVIIVGAGISGMVAAYNIQQHIPMLKILVLEAQDRIGGRTLTVPIVDNNNEIKLVDIGGHWTSSSQIHISTLCQQLDLTLIPQYHKGNSIVDVGDDNYHTYDQHPIVGNNLMQYELKQFILKLEELCESYSIVSVHDECEKNHYDSITMAEFINTNLQTEGGRKIAAGLIKTTCGLDANDITALSFMVFCNGSFGFTNQYVTIDGGARESWIEESASEICTRIERKLEKDTVVLNNSVRQITQKTRHVVIETNKRFYTCRYVIISIPPKDVLKIDFQPALSVEKYKNLENTQSCYITKFVLSYKEFFWRKNNFSGQILCNNKLVMICHDTSTETNPLITGYIFPVKTCCSLQTLITYQLSRYWGEDATEPIDFVSHDWEYQICNTSCITCQSTDDRKYYRRLSQAEGRLHWAGTEMATQWNGFMEGAVQAGYRASVEVLYSLYPQSLSYKDMIYSYYNIQHKKHIKRSLLTDDPLVVPLVVGGIIAGGVGIYKYMYFNKD